MPKNLRKMCRLLLMASMSNREIARQTGLSHNTVDRYRVRVEELKLTWSDVKDIDNFELDAILNDVRHKHRNRFVEPDWKEVHTELEKRGVTLTLLHLEYTQASAGQGQLLSESEFRRRFERYRRSLGLSMRQVHVAGEKIFLDYSGMTAWITDPEAGEKRPAQIFVAVLGASRLVYAEATESQKLCDWVGANVRALHYIGGVPTYLVPDNLKSAVTKVSWRDGPTINPTYNEFAEYYETIVAPTRSRKPKDKALVEDSVLIVQRWILARLRHRTFHSLAELNAAIAVLVEDINNRPMKKLAGQTRRQRFEEIDHPALKPLPAQPYEFAEWRIGVKIAGDYVVAWDYHYYSVPYRLVGTRVDVKATSTAIEIFRGGKRVATHLRSNKVGESTIDPEHMPPNHRRYRDGDGEQLLAWAHATGPAIGEFVERHRATHRAPNASFQACRGLKALAREYGTERLNAACGRALALNAMSITSVRSTLHHGWESRPLPAKEEATRAHASHDNVRGSPYFSE